MLRRLLAAGTTMAVLAIMPAASAQTTVTNDKEGDGARDRDARKVTVHHRDKRVRLKTRMFRGSQLPDEMWHLVDTQGDATPEFIVFVVVANEVDPKPDVGVYEVDRWPGKKDPYNAWQKGERVDCGLHQARKRDHRRLLNTLVGRGCFKTDGAMPTRLRVNSFGTFEFGKVTDSVPGWRRYGAWITSD